MVIITGTESLAYLRRAHYLLPPFHLATVSASILLVNSFPHATLDFTAISGSLSPRTGGTRH